MFLHLSLFSLLAIVAADTVPTLEKSSLPSGVLDIVNGVATTIEEVPYHVFLYSPGSKIQCGGSIISKEWVLTAAQCMPDAEHYLKVRAGSASKWVGGTDHAVMNITVHENYTITADGIHINDVAVIRVRPAFDLDPQHQPITIYEQGDGVYPGENVTLTGWGSSWDETQGRTMEVLNELQLALITNQACLDAYNIEELPEGKFCAALPDTTKGACKGNQGGSAKMYNRLAGIISTTQDCSSTTRLPSILTNVAAYSDWICDVIECEKRE